MRFSLITGAGVLAAATALAPTLAAAQQASGQSGQQPQMQQQTNSGQQLQGEGAPIYVSPHEVRLVQRRLARLGFDPGPIDGQWRPETQQALAQFQQQAGLSPTGNINITTFQALRSVRRPGGQFLGLGQPQSGMGMQRPGMRFQQGTQR